MLSKKHKYLLLFTLLVGFMALLGSALSEDSNRESYAVVRGFPEQKVERLMGGEPAETKALFQSEYQLVNVWASWCSICRSEHAFLNQLSQQGITIIGLNYRDQKNAAEQYLRQLGNPYRSVIYDPKGVLSIDLGVVGTPETYLVNRAGEIVYKHSGLLSTSSWQRKFAHFFESETQQ
ncbi:DsbE family thiol:disulfide interchange protein [Vibrio sp. Isolate24]|uniref:DsbE family thiol:disulfide interchange protein n=1 Tax=Vibrio sp. Isolate24 TaxID=2908534 RepID=UPI001EFC7E06|nr:DsbE family thiol:disulfide interchange protein [Vibrio sp. Isolate24]MCG9679510.1 DsbE family thiol:disulfide interchange protein [Vibrio sp. Isolate24]